MIESVEIEKYINQIKTETDVFNKAKLLLHLIRNKGLRLNSLSRMLEIKSSYLCHYLRLNRLPEIIIDGYYSKFITLSHLFVISRIKETDKLMKIYEKILEKNLTVVQTEEMVRNLLHETKTEGKYITLDQKNNYCNSIDKIDESIKAKIVQTRIKAKIIIEIKGSLQKTTGIIKSILDKIVQ